MMFFRLQRLWPLGYCASPSPAPFPASHLKNRKLASMSPTLVCFFWNSGLEWFFFSWENLVFVPSQRQRQRRRHPRRHHRCCWRHRRCRRRRRPFDVCSFGQLFSSSTNFQCLTWKEADMMLAEGRATFGRKISNETSNSLFRPILATVEDNFSDSRLSSYDYRLLS